MNSRHVPVIGCLCGVSLLLSGLMLSAGKEHVRRLYARAAAAEARLARLEQTVIVGQRTVAQAAPRNVFQLSSEAVLSGPLVVVPASRPWEITLGGGR